MTLEILRDVLAIAAFVTLCGRTGQSWPADWAKPDHVAHYRFLLCITSGLTLGVLLAAWDYHHSGHQPDVMISIFYAALSVLVLVFCWLWPRPRSFREDDQ